MRSGSGRSSCTSVPARVRGAPSVDEHVPQLAQEQHVGAQRLGRRALGRGAHDVATRLARACSEHCMQLAQPCALGFVLDARRDADAVPVRHVDEVARRDRDERREPRALGAERILQHLHQDVAALADELADVLGARFARRAFGIRRLHDVGDVQERRALEADVDEGRLHAGQHARHAPLVDVADEAEAARPLDEDLLQHAVLDQRRAGFARADVDEDFRGHGAWVFHPIRPSAGASSSEVSNSGSPITPE